LDYFDEYVLIRASSQSCNSQDIQAVISTDHTNINRELIHRGYGVFREDLGGAEQQAMHGRLGRLFGKYSEEMFFEGDQSAANPMRYLPTPFHTKYAQQRTALSQYIQQEAVGTRMRRWERPIYDFLAPYLCGAIARVTGEDIISEEVQHRGNLDTLTGPGPFPAPHNISLPRAGEGPPSLSRAPLSSAHPQPAAHRPSLLSINCTLYAGILRALSITM
jgi:hypothetical protein